MPAEDSWTPPSAWCPKPQLWHSDDAYASEHEVSALVAAFVTALQPEIVVETGTNSGQTAQAIGRALAASGHGVLYTLEIDAALAARAAERCQGLPVQVIVADSLSWEPPGPVGFAWLDSHIGIRAAELERLLPHLDGAAVVGVHDTGPQHQVAMSLQPLIDAGRFHCLTLRTPRGVTFGIPTGG
jgi:hypothetical protein